MCKCCSTCKIRKKNKQTKRFPSIFRYITQWMFLIFMNELPSHFPFLKLNHWNKWVFSFSWGQGVYSIIFSINTMDMLCSIFCSQEYLNWLTTDILRWLSVMQIFTVWDSKGHYFQRIHTCRLHRKRHSGLQIGFRAMTPHVTIWKMTFYQDHLLLWIWVSADSIQVNCCLCPYVLQNVCAAIQIDFMSLFHSTSFCISLYIYSIYISPCDI